MDSHDALAQMLNQLSSKEATPYDNALNSLRNLKKQAASDEAAKWEYFAVLSEVKDMARGVRHLNIGRRGHDGGTRAPLF